MNSILIIGNLTKDVELRYTMNGKAVAKFTVAVPRGFGSDSKTDFIKVATWEGLAENCAKFLSKGKKVGVRGRLQIDSYEDRETGKTMYISEISAGEVEFLSPKSGGDKRESYASSKKNKENNEEKVESKQESNQDEEEQIEDFVPMSIVGDDDLPF